MAIATGGPHFFWGDVAAEAAGVRDVCGDTTNLGGSLRWLPCAVLRVRGIVPLRVLRERWSGNAGGPGQPGKAILQMRAASPCVLAGVLVLAAIVVIVNVSLDVIYGFIDPRLRVR